MITLLIITLVLLFVFFYVAAYALAFLMWVGIFLWTVISGIFSHFLGGRK